LLTSNTASNNDYGLLLYDSSSNSLTSNTANSNKDYGIYLEYATGGNLIYNNYFNNTTNARQDDGYTTWNIIKTSGTNIIGGPYLGGNYWAYYTGDDLNGDGLGDTRSYYSPHVVYSSDGIEYGADYLPLVPCTSPP